MIFKKKARQVKSYETAPNVTKISDREEIPTKEIVSYENKNKDPVQSLISLLSSNGTKEVKPFIDFNEGRIRYPTLRSIGEEDHNVDFLENLAKKGILEKSVYERLLVCPTHPQYISANMRIYCPVCNSPNIGKLQLYEHKICGYITESKHFESEQDSLQCPSCKKIIQKPQTELRLPAKWYQCFECSNRFDDVSIRLHCRQFDHDFDPNSAKMLVVHSYTMSSKATTNPDVSVIVEQTKQLLIDEDFNTETERSIRTKKGRNYTVDIFCENQKGTAVVFIDKKQNTIDAYLDSVIVAVLDLSPTIAILVSDNISQDSKERARTYDIMTINTKELSEISAGIANTVKTFLADKKNGR